MLSRSTLDMMDMAYKETVGLLFPVMRSGILAVRLKTWVIVSLLIL